MQFALTVNVVCAALLARAVAIEYPLVDKSISVSALPLMYMGVAFWAQKSCNSSESKLGMWFIVVPVSITNPIPGFH